MPLDFIEAERIRGAGENAQVGPGRGQAVFCGILGGKIVGNERKKRIEFSK